MSDYCPRIQPCVLKQWCGGCCEVRVDEPIGVMEHRSRSICRCHSSWRFEEANQRNRQSQPGYLDVAQLPQNQETHAYLGLRLWINLPHSRHDVWRKS